MIWDRLLDFTARHKLSKERCHPSWVVIRNHHSQLFRFSHFYHHSRAEVTRAVIREWESEWGETRSGSPQFLMAEMSQQNHIFYPDETMFNFCRWRENARRRNR